MILEVAHSQFWRPNRKIDDIQTPTSNKDLHRGMACKPSARHGSRKGFQMFYSKKSTDVYLKSKKLVDEKVVTLLLAADYQSSS